MAKHGVLLGVFQRTAPSLAVADNTFDRDDLAMAALTTNPKAKKVKLNVAVSRRSFSSQEPGSDTS